MQRRILLLITDLEIGGTPTVVRELAIRLRETQRVEVEVACLSKWGPVADQLHTAGVKVTALGATRPTDLHVLRDLVRLIRERQFDTVFSFLIHANTMAAIASLFCRGTRFVQSIQTTQPHPRWHWIVQRVVHHFADTIVVPSESIATAARNWADVPADKIVVIPNAVELCATHRDSSISELVEVGFVGRLDPIKRVPDLLAAMALLEDRFVLHIFGEGEDRGRIEAEIERLQIQDRVYLHGLTAKPQAAMGDVDLLVLCSQAEGMPVVLLEAMAAGVPVVGTDVPGIRDVIRDGFSGLLVPVASPVELAGAIRRVAGDEALREELVRNALKDVSDKFSWERVLTLYRNVLEI